MSYVLPNWQDAPSTATPIDAAELDLYNVAINDLDTRVSGTVAPTISSVGAAATSGGTGTTTLSVSPTAVGDVLVLATNLTSTSLSVSAVSGGGVTTWTRIVGPYVGTTNTLGLWMGSVTTTGAATITITGSGSLASTAVKLLAQQFTSTAAAGTTWALDVAGTGRNNSASTTVSFPTITPGGANRAYIGYASTASAASTSGQSAGYTVRLDTGSDPFLYDPNVSGAQSPTAVQTSAGTSSAIGATLKATGNVVFSVGTVDSTITVAGTASNPTVAVNTIAESKVTNLTTDLATKASTASPTFTGTVTTAALTANGTSTFAKLVETPVALTDGATISVNAALGNTFRVTLGGNRTIAAPSNPTDGQQITFVLIQPATGGPFTVTWTSGAGGYRFDYPAPILNTAANLRDFVRFTYSSATSTWIYCPTSAAPLAASYQSGGAWGNYVYGDLMANMQREDVGGSLLLTTTTKTVLMLLGLAPPNVYSVFKLFVATAGTSGTTTSAALYSSSSLTSTSWTRLGAGNVTPVVTAIGLVSTSLAFTLSSPAFVVLELVVTSSLATLPSFAATSSTGAITALLNPTSGCPVSATLNAATAPAATLNPTTGFTNIAQKIWCALA